MDVIDFEERRRLAAGPEQDLAQCPCGEAWFELRPGASAPFGAVCMDRSGG